MNFLEEWKACHDAIKEAHKKIHPSELETSIIVKITVYGDMSGHIVSSDSYPHSEYEWASFGNLSEMKEALTRPYTHPTHIEWTDGTRKEWQSE